MYVEMHFSLSVCRKQGEMRNVSLYSMTNRGFEREPTPQPACEVGPRSQIVAQHGKPWLRIAKDFSAMSESCFFSKFVSVSFILFI